MEVSWRGTPAGWFIDVYFMEKVMRKIDENWG
jgi:hypothetical protein